MTPRVLTLVCPPVTLGAERVWSRIEGNYQSSLRAGANGRVLVAIDRTRTASEIRVIVNWQQEIAAKLK